ncbi:MAG: P-loop NTPase fold protein [bacterium]
MALLGAIAQGLRPRGGSKGWETVESIGKAVGSFAFRAGTGFVFGRQLLPEQGTGSGGLQNGEDAAAYFPGKAVDAVQSVKTGFKALVDAALEGKGPTARVLVCLDDLDRCLPADVVALIEAVKLLLVGEAGCRAVFAFALDARSWAGHPAAVPGCDRATPVKTIWKGVRPVAGGAAGARSAGHSSNTSKPRWVAYRC